MAPTGEVVQYTVGPALRIASVAYYHLVQKQGAKRKMMQLWSNNYRLWFRAHHRRRSPRRATACGGSTNYVKLFCGSSHPKTIDI